jgi:hypothetical protein
MIPKLLEGRLETLATKIRSRTVQHLFIFMHEGETMQELDVRIERWKAGATDTGISGVYEGGEIEYARPFRFVDPPIREAE